MYVNRLRLYNVKPLRRDIPADEAELPESARRRLLFQGGNGTGKTTILETIRKLWEFFGEWIDRGPNKPPLTHQARHYLGRADLAAMELRDFPGRGDSLWIGMGRANDWEELKRQAPASSYAGLVRYGKEPNQARVSLPERDWKSLRARSMVGSEPMPNIVHFPPDNRTLAGPPPSGPHLIDPIPLNWSAPFNPKQDLDSILLTIKALRPDDFSKSLRLVNLALKHRDKQITDFGPQGRLEVEGTTDFGVGFRHPLELLSSGERQMLLLIAHTVAFLRPGGLLLVDEPDLHIHVSMAAQLMETLDLIAQERDAQLIVASHSALVWDWFDDDQRIDLSGWRGDKA